MSNNNKKLGLAGKIAHIFVNNSRLSILLIIALFAWGVFSFFVTPKQYNPEIVKPTFQVITEYPGASSSEVEKLVTQPLESKLDEMTGVDEITSKSIDGGVSVVTLSFEVGENIQESKIKVIQKIYGNLDLKPTGVKDSIIKEINPYNVPILTMVFHSKEYSPTTLRNMALDLKKEFKDVDNATNIEVTGGKTEHIRVLLNPNKIQAQNISLSQILGGLKQNNIKMPAGNLEVGDNNIQVEVDGRVETIQEVKNLVIHKQPDQVVKLQDVASVELSPQETRDYVKYQVQDNTDQEAVYLSLAKKRGENISEVVDPAQEKLAQLQKDNTIPGSVEVETIRNKGETAQEEISSLVMSLIQAILIVSVILFLFLGKRPALIVIIAIPLILFSVFGIGLLADKNINRITLFALILSLGLLVDNAIVVVENAVRAVKKACVRDENGVLQCLTPEAKRKEVLDSVDEVGPGIGMATITTILAFIPMAFVTGMMGPYMGPIPFFVPVTLIFSIFIAFTINPFLSSILIKETEGEKTKKKLARKFNTITSKLLNFYKNFLYKVFHNRKLKKQILIGTFLALLVVMSLPIFELVKFRMLPKADKEQFLVYLDYSPGTTVEKNNKITSQVEDFLLDNEEVTSIQSFVGTPPIVDFNGLFRGVEARNKQHQSTLKVNLTDTEKRQVSSIKLVETLRPELYKFLEDRPEIDIKFIETPPGPPVQSTALIKIKGKDYDTLKKISYDVEKLFQETEGITDITTSRVNSGDEISLKLDSETVSRSGLSSHEVATKLRTLIKGSQVSVFHQDENEEQQYIFLRLKKEFRNSPQNLDSIYLSNRRGEKIPLSELVEKERGSIEDVINRDDREKVVYVKGEMQERSVTYAALESFSWLKNYTLPSQTGEVTNMSLFGAEYKNQAGGENYSIKWGGEWELTLEVFRDLGIAMMVAVFLIYLFLVAKFRSFRVPFLILTTIPLAMIGVMPGFALLQLTSGIYFNATSMIGIIALSGIVVNNAILLIEYLNLFKKRGHSLEESLVEAGAVRARPIILTSLTTILGSLVMATDRVWAGLAWSIAFGLSISAILTLVIFPILYHAIMKSSNK